MVEPTTDNRETLDRNHVLLPVDSENYFRHVLRESRKKLFPNPGVDRKQ